MDSWNPLSSPTGSRRAIGVLGLLFVALAVGRTLVRLEQGIGFGTVLIVTLLISLPGVTLACGSYWLSRSDIDAAFYPTVLRWCLAGFGTMVAILLLYHAQPEGSISSPATSPPILAALSSVAGFAVGVHDARAKTRTRQLTQRNRELERTQAELEETVQRLEETNARLEASEQRYRTLAENFPNGAVALIDEELRHTLVEGQGFEKVDFDADDLRGERVRDVYPPPIRERLEPRFRAALDGEPSAFELTIQDRTFEFRTLPVGSEGDGEDAFAVLAMSQDVTERKARERELERRARQQRVVAELGQFALETEDPDELMAEANRKVADVLDNEYCKVLDLDDEGEELLLRQGVGWRDGIVGEATVSAHEGGSQAAYTLAADGPVVVEDLESETRFSGPDLLRSHGVHAGISTVIGPFDETWGILGTHDTEPRAYTEEDVTFVQSVSNVLAEAIERHQYRADLEALVADLEASNERLEESNRRLEQFAYAASHDLQEPLRMVSTYLQLIERRYAGELGDDGEEFLEYAVDGADRMRGMIDGLLQYSRVETEGDPFEPVELGTVLEDACDDLRMQIEKHDAEITAESLPCVSGDADQLRQVFQNLLSNAIRYSGEGPPRVHVAAERNGAEWTVSVADEGIGIAPADQDRIFEVFEGLPVEGEYPGTGIGLAVCERILERHGVRASSAGSQSESAGGEIWVESESGDGATFSFTLPAVDADLENELEADRTPGHSQGTSSHVRDR